jgi:hypothetical protein
MSVHDALKKMHNGHYLNIPVVEDDGRLVAIVDVLTLTYATLEQMNVMSGEAGQNTEAEGGPMWGRFFDSIGHEDTESVISGSRIPADNSLQNIVQQSPHSEVHPDDSASVMDDDPVSALEGYPRKKNGFIVPSIISPLSIPIDDGTYVFKFRTPSGRTHRFQARHDDVENLRDIVHGKLNADPFFTDFKPSSESEPKPDPLDFQLSYTDTDGDTVVITSDHDVTDAVKIARGAGTDRVVLFVQGGKGWQEEGSGKSEAKAAEVNAAAQENVEEVEKAESALPESIKLPPPPPIHTPLPDDVMGIPKDLLLPASIGALAVVILGVFTISRLSSSRY